MSSKNCKVAVVIPCYRSSGQVLDVLAQIPDMVDAIYCVDDACPDGTGKFIADNCQDKRVQLHYHKQNKGVGGAVITGYRQALKGGADIVVKIDSDGQMNPALLPSFIAPIVMGRADYTKGNRFFTPEFLSGMPKLRLVGNAGLSFLSKFSTGYWQIFDPTNGYTAIHANVLRLLPLDKINQRYFFESDMLFRLGSLKAMVVDVPQQALYADETSHLSELGACLSFAGRHVANFFKRIIYNYFIRDFHLASLEWLLGPLLLLFSVVFGLNAWGESVENGTVATAGTVMLAALPFITGMQLTLSALHFDIQNQPKSPLHPFLNK